MSEFKREDRYIVLKLSKMSDFQKDMIYPVIEEHGIPQVDCVVVEDDWPEYEAVWRMIERRVTGSPPPSRLEMKHVMQALDQVRGGPVLTSNQCHDLAMLLNDYLPIENAAQVELAALREELAGAKHDIASFLETMAKVCDLLGINTEDAKHAEGNPSDVFFSHATVMQQRLTAAEQRNSDLTDLLVRTLAYYTESCFPEDLLLEVKVAIRSVKPTESGASE